VSRKTAYSDIAISHVVLTEEMNTKCGKNARKREMSISGKERDKK
jgi:hypothetical protein